MIVLGPRNGGVDPALIRHEEKHVDQAAAMCPRFLRWLPRRVRAWIGAPKFWRAYFDEHRRHGYSGNAYEIVARAAEGDDDVTPGPFTP